MHSLSPAYICASACNVEPWTCFQTRWPLQGALIKQGSPPRAFRASAPCLLQAGHLTASPAEPSTNKAPWCCVVLALIVQSHEGAASTQYIMLRRSSKAVVFAAQSFTLSGVLCDDVCVFACTHMTGVHIGNMSYHPAVFEGRLALLLQALQAVGPQNGLGWAGWALHVFTSA